MPAGQRVTLVANNYVPFDLSAAGSEQVAAISFKVSGGLSSISAGTLAIGFGLFNNNGTAQLLVTGGNFTGITTLTNNSTNATGISVTAANTLSANSVCESSHVN